MIRRIEKYENYLISDDGVVKNLKGQIIKPYIINSGYKVVTLWKKNIKSHFLVHRLVAKHFLPYFNDCLVVDHIDGDKLNNNALNLRVCTQKENINAGNYIKKIGLNHPMCVITPETISEIKRMRDEEKMPFHEISKKLGFSRQTAANVYYGKYNYQEDTVLTK